MAEGDSPIPDTPSPLNIEPRYTSETARRTLAITPGPLSSTFVPETRAMGLKTSSTPQNSTA